MIKKCPICGKEFDGTKAQKRCLSCRYIRPRFDKQCTVCGKVFSAGSKKALYCRDCYRKLVAERSAAATLKACAENRETASLRNSQDTARMEVLALHNSGYSNNEIYLKTGVSASKIKKILVDAGIIETKEAELFKKGFSIAEIAEILGESKRAVYAKVPYEGSIYNSSSPTQNALRLRKWKKSKSRTDPNKEE